VNKVIIRRVGSRFQWQIMVNGELVATITAHGDPSNAINVLDTVTEVARALGAEVTR